MIAVRLAIVAGIFYGALAHGIAPDETSDKAPLAAHSLLLDGVVIDGRIVAVGQWGHILISDDHGQSWRQVEVPTRATLTAVFFVDRKRGWAVGHDAIILRTQTGGETWERVYYAPEEERPLFDVWFRDAEHGFAIGAYGLLLRTTDGGDTWSSSDVVEEDWTEALDDLGEGSDFHLNHIARSDTGRLYVAAEAGKIYRSDDDGESWISLPSPYHGSFFGTLLLENDALLLFGLRGNLYRSENTGDSWEAIETHTEAMLTDGVQLEDGTTIVAGHAGTLLVSADGGHKFALEQQPDRQALATVVQADDGSLILIGEFGVTKLPRSKATSGQERKPR